MAFSKGEQIIMSADYMIHVCKTKKEEHQAELFLKCDCYSSEIGNAYTEVKVNGEWISLQDYDYETETEDMRTIPLPELDDKVIYKTKAIWIGEVSWLKADLFDDVDFIPNVVDKINALITGLTVIDDELIEKIKEAFKLPNNTIKENGVWDGKGYKIADSKKVIKFLKQHKGRKCFTVSW